MSCVQEIQSLAFDDYEGDAEEDDARIEKLLSKSKKAIR